MNNKIIHRGPDDDGEFYEKIGANHIEMGMRRLSIIDLNSSINKLQMHQKNCIQKFYIDKKSYQEISIEENMTLNEVKSHLQNGKRNLKILMTNPEKNAK